MLRLLTVLLFILHLAVPVALFAAPEPPVLFEQFTYKMPRSEVAKLPGAVKGEAEFAGDLIFPGATFAGLSWVARCEFRDDELRRISLMEAYSAERMQAVVTILRQTGYEPLGMLLDGMSLDFISLLKAGGPEALQQEVKKLMQEAKGERITYAWFDINKVSDGMRGMASSLPNLLMSVASDTREIEVTILQGEKIAAAAVMFIDFSFPILDGATRAE